MNYLDLEFIQKWVDISEQELMERLVKDAVGLQKEAEETGVPYHELLYNAETLKTEFNEYNAMAAEYTIIRDNALINVVDNLTFIELWKELGFTEVFTNTPIEKQRIQYTIDIFTDDLTEVYNYIKTNILINTEDC